MAPAGRGGGVIRTLSDRHERFFVWFEIYHSQISLSCKIWEVFFGVAWVVFFCWGGGGDYKPPVPCDIWVLIFALIR